MTRPKNSNERATPLQVKPVSIVQRRKAYRVPRHPAPTDLRLDGNEGQAPSSDLYQALFESGIEAASNYPKAQALENTLAQFWKLPAERVLVTAGGDDAIDRISRVMLSEGKELIFPSPSFEMMAQYGEIAGGQLVRVEWTPGTPYPLEAVLQKISPNTGIIAVISPNNPTGTTVALKSIQELAQAAPHAIILLDLAYIEFADVDPTQDALQCPNVLITRTFSKAWGLAGIRVGYALGHAQVIEWMRIAGEPYAVSGPSLVLAQSRFEQARDDVDAFVERVRLERTQLEQLLSSYGGQTIPSQANFVCTQFPRAEWLRDGCAGLGIAIRFFPNNPALAERLRITCPGDPEAFKRLEKTIHTIQAPEALIFDMDGVLVDVSQSYREAILQTAAHFGVELEAFEITRFKAEGNANNDWLVTQKLLLQHGVDVELQSVIDLFEAKYQGTHECPGLRLKERLLVSKEQLTQWSKRLPLGIVTGRPRRDAEDLLERFGLRHLFSSIVCMEDAPAKPSPEPVLLALKELHVERAWMLGDTPDDQRAARAASVLPIGVLAPGESADAMQLPLLQSGAARVWKTTCELNAYLEHIFSNTSQGVFA